MPVTTVKAIKRFDTPKTMAGALDAILESVTVNLPIETGDDEAAQTQRQTTVDMLKTWRTGLLLPTLILFTSPPNPTLDSSYTDLVQPVGSWYAPVAATMGTEYAPDGLNIQTESQEHQWQYSGTDPAETVVGIALVETR